MATTLSTAKPNVLIILGVGILAQIIYLQAPFLETAGMAALVVSWLPLAGAVVSLISYFIARAIAPSVAHYVTFLSIAMQLFLLYQGFFIGG